MSGKTTTSTTKTASCCNGRPNRRVRGSNESDGLGLRQQRRLDEAVHGQRLERQCVDRVELVRSVHMWRQQFPDCRSRRPRGSNETHIMFLRAKWSSMDEAKAQLLSNHWSAGGTGKRCNDEICDDRFQCLGSTTTCSEQLSSRKTSVDVWLLTTSPMRSQQHVR